MHWPRNLHERDRAACRWLRFAAPAVAFFVSSAIICRRSASLNGAWTLRSWYCCAPALTGSPNSSSARHVPEEDARQPVVSQQSPTP